MKLTRRLLAVVLSVAMLIGMVAVGATASITDYYEYDPVNNPYTAKIGLKVFKVNTDDDTYTEITDGAVDAGDVVRVEVWSQTNYFTTLMSYAVMYDNRLLQGTTLDYTTYDYYARPSTVSYAKVVAQYPMDEDHAYSVDGTLDAPFYSNECLVLTSSGFIGKTTAMNYANVKKNMPREWQGTGTKETNYYSNAEALNYNYLLAGVTADTNYNQPGAGNHIILTEYQPVLYFNLTIPEGTADGTTGTISIPKGTLYTSSATGSTYIARSYTEDGSGEETAATDNLQFINTTSWAPGIDYYGDDTTTKYDRVYDLSEATVTLTVGGASSEETTTAEPETEEPTTEEPTTEETTTAIEYANLDDLKAAITAAEAADLENRTSATLKAYNEALAAAQALVAANPLLAQQADVDAATKTLNDAVAGLAYLGTCNYDALDDAIAAYEAKVADKDNYSNWAEYEAAYTEATNVTRGMVADEAGANQATIDAAAKALNDVVLVPYEACDYTDYNAAVKAAGELVEGDYTTSSWAAADVAAVVAANEVEAGLLDKDGNQDMINAAAAAINAAIAKLEKKADVSALQAAVDAEPTVAEEYATAETWEDYATAKAEAEALLANAADLGVSQADAIAAAAEKLNTANDALVEDEASYAVVEEAKAKIPADLSGYTAESVDNLNAAVAAVEAGVKKSEQAKVNAWAADIELAVKNLVPLGGCNYEALDAAIKAYEDLVKADYKPTSWDESGVDAAYDAATKVDRNLIADEAGANQAAINAAATALTDAIAKLDKVADKTALQAAIADASKLLETDYTPDSWAAADLETVLSEANNVLANGDATDVDVADAIDSIEYAVSLLDKKADKSALKAAIDAANALVETDYTPTSWSDSDIEMIIEEAEYVYNNENALDTDVANALESLENAVEMLDPVADKTALKAAIDTVVDTENCEAESVKAYEEALAAANNVYADPDATKEAVETATNNLLAAIDGVKKLGGCDYTRYDAAVKAAGELVEGDYTTSSWAAADVAAVVAANEVAKDLIADEDGVNQAAINAAADAIEAAIAKLEKKADVSALQAAVDAEPTVAEEYATTETWADYATAKAEAEALLANAADLGVSQADAIAAAAEKLNTANENLVEEAADYSAVDAAKAKIPADLSIYTQTSVAALNKAVNAVVEGLGKSKQEDVNAMAKAIEEAIEGLKENKAAITNLDVDLDGYMKKAAKEYTFTVQGAPSKIQIKGQKGSTGTFDRYHSSVTIVSYNAAGEVIDYLDEEPAYEEWTIVMALGEGEFTAKAKFGSVWEAEAFEFEVTMYKPREAAVTFVAKDSASEEEANKVLSVKKGTIVEITVVAPTTVKKVQLLFKSGTTSTYTANHSAVTYVDNGDGTATWTILRAFNGVGTNGTMTLKLKDASGWYTAATEIISTEVTR